MIGEMNTPKLPPPPKPDTHCFDEDTGKDVWGHSPEQMQAYALAAIEALWAQIGRGVPDGLQLVPKEPTDEMVRAALHLDLSYMPGHDGPDRAAVYKAMLASAPPAPQANKTHVLVPLRMTRAMQDVVSEEDWSWADLLAAAEAVTEDEFAVAEQTEPIMPQAAVMQQKPLTDEQIEAIYTQETGSLIDDSPWALVDFVRAIEAAHNIGEKK